jgi:hypothetical protein
VLCATSGSNCTWPSVAAGKEQNNIRWKNIIETQDTSEFSYTVFSTQKAFQRTYGKEVPIGKNLQEKCGNKLYFWIHFCIVIPSNSQYFNNEDSKGILPEWPGYTVIFNTEKFVHVMVHHLKYTSPNTSLLLLHSFYSVEKFVAFNYVTSLALYLI